GHFLGQVLEPLAHQPRHLLGARLAAGHGAERPEAYLVSGQALAPYLRELHVDAVQLLERSVPGTVARSAGADQGAVDVEEDGARNGAEASGVAKRATW